MHTVLGIETSGSATSVALVQGGKRLDRASAEEAASHTESLAQLLGELLARNRLRATELSAIVISEGPGSFTGLRIGFAFAKGLAIALDIPVYPVSSLAVLVQAAEAGTGTVTALRDARRGEAFVETYEIASCGALKAIGQVSIVKLEDLARGVEDTSVFVCDNTLGILPFKSVRVEPGGEHSVFAFHALGGRIFGPDPKKLIGLEPLYVRAVAARTIQERLEMPR